MAILEDIMVLLDDNKVESAVWLVVIEDWELVIVNNIVELPDELVELCFGLVVICDEIVVFGDWILILDDNIVEPIDGVVSFGGRVLFPDGIVEFVEFIFAGIMQWALYSFIFKLKIKSSINESLLVPSTSNVVKPNSLHLKFVNFSIFILAPKMHDINKAIIIAAIFSIFKLYESKNNNL